VTTLLHILSSAPSPTPLFFGAQGTISAGQIRATASDIARGLPDGGALYLHTASAALFAAGLLAAARKSRTVCCPAHTQSLYLSEIGADTGTIVTDAPLEHSSVLRAALSPDEEDGSQTPAGLELVFYTSGSTGKPKTVGKPIAQLDAEAHTLETVWPKGARRMLGTVSHQHIYGMLFRIFWPVLTGGQSSERPAEYWEQLAPHLMAGTSLASGPAHLTRLAPLARAKPDRIYSSGAPLPFAAAQEAKDLLGSLPFEVLGSTETGGIAWRQQEREDAAWTPLPGVEVDIDPDSVLNIRSPFAIPGAFVATGDRAERINAQQFRLKGRADRLAKIDGKRVSLVRVEEAVLSHPMVAAVAATDLPNRKGGLGAIVELNDVGLAALKAQGSFRLSRSLRRELAARLEPAERPKHWLFASIPLNSQGKRVQANLRDAFDRGALRGTVQALRPESAEVVFELDPALSWFEGHFPGQPVLPGIAQVHMAVKWAERLWQWRPKGASLSQLKFRRVLQPGDLVELRLARPAGQQRLKFAYHLGSIVASEGIVGDSE
jgi:acyl-CoA synthetase (AMP-forming)/AMP-acid ligase II